MLVLLCLPTWAVSADRFSKDEMSAYDHSWYMGLAFGQFTYQQDNLSDFTMTDRRLIFGKQLSRVFALEVHVGNSSSDTQLVSGVPVTLKVDNYVAGFLKMNATFASKEWDYNRLRLYALIGGTYLKATSTDPGSTSDGSQSSVAGGVGLEFFHENLGFQLGYTRYLTGSSNNQDYNLDSLYLGIIYQFSGN